MLSYADGASRPSIEGPAAGRNMPLVERLCCSIMVLCQCHSAVGTLRASGYGHCTGTITGRASGHRETTARRARSPDPGEYTKRRACHYHKWPAHETPGPLLPVRLARLLRLQQPTPFFGKACLSISKSSRLGPRPAQPPAKLRSAPHSCELELDVSSAGQPAQVTAGRARTLCLMTIRVMCVRRVRAT